MSLWNNSPMSSFRFSSAGEEFIKCGEVETKADSSPALLNRNDSLLYSDQKPVKGFASTAKFNSCRRGKAVGNVLRRMP